MADEADISEYYIESVIDDHVKEAMRRVLDIPVGNPGDCSICGEWSGRLVGDACSPCRDKYRL